MADCRLAGFGPELAVAYLLGGMDGNGAEWADHASARAAIEAADYAGLVDDLHEELRRLWDTCDSWGPTLVTFAGLEATTKATFESNGIFFHTDAEGQCHIDVPFMPNNMPA